MKNLQYTLEAKVETENQELKIEITEDSIQVRDESGAFLLNMYREDFDKVLEVLEEYKSTTGGKP